MARTVLHVVGGMVRGGVETWLMHVFRNIDRSRYRMDVAVHTTMPCAYDGELRSLGIRILPCTGPSWPISYAVRFSRLLKENGPYDVVHSHVYHYSGFVLRLAYQAGVPIRIAHSHNDTRVTRAKDGLLRRCYVALASRWIRQYATCGLAASRRAAEALFGPQWEEDPRWRTLYYGHDLRPFETEVDPAAVRRELGIPPHARVVGHVGRFHEQKNHKFLVEIARQLASRDPQIVFLLVGDGPLRPAIAALAREAGLGDRVKFALVRADVPRLMKGAMDVFLLPSLHEGCPLVLAEAQAAGLPCIISDVIAEEADVVGSLMTRLSVTQPAQVWAEAVLAAMAEGRTVDPWLALKTITRSRFSLQNCVNELAAVYDA
jgi:glycosyltransferase involved in cell wall biosynthesis